MKTNLFIATALFLVSAPLPSAAQARLDMNKLTCGDLISYSAGNQQFIRFWLTGYYNAAANSTVLDYQRSQNNAAKVARHCKRHKSDTLPTAIKKATS